jgi:hypothetical protein
MVEFTDERIRAAWKVSKEIFEVTMHVGMAEDDMLRDLYTVFIEAKIKTRLSEQRELTYYCPRPTFFDWLFRRTKRVKFNLDISHLKLREAPEGTVNIYDIK